MTTVEIIMTLATGLLAIIAGGSKKPLPINLKPQDWEDLFLLGAIAVAFVKPPLEGEYIQNSGVSILVMIAISRVSYITQKSRKKK